MTFKFNILPNVKQYLEELEQFTLLMKIEPFLHDKVFLHEFKKIYPQYNSKQLILVADITPIKYEIYEKQNSENNKFVDWYDIVIPDAIFYDEQDGTYSSIQYRYMWERTIRDLWKGDLFCTYNPSQNPPIHMMNIVTIDKETFDDMCEVLPDVLLETKYEFDVKLRTQYEDIELILSEQLIREVDAADHKFMDRIGYQVKNEDFYKDFNNQDYSKYKYDKEFVKNFYEFVEVYKKEKFKVQEIPWVWMESPYNKK